MVIYRVKGGDREPRENDTADKQIGGKTPNRKDSEQTERRDRDEKKQRGSGRMREKRGCPVVAGGKRAICFAGRSGQPRRLLFADRTIRAHRQKLLK